MILAYLIQTLWGAALVTASIKTAFSSWTALIGSIGLILFVSGVQGSSEGYSDLHLKLGFFHL